MKQSPSPIPKQSPIAPSSSFRRKDRFVAVSSPPADPSISFDSPPLLPGLRSCLLDAIGRNSKPFPIQAFSLQHFIGTSDQPPAIPFPPSSSQTLLASETGSGKSYAYLLPVIQALKLTESPPIETETDESGLNGPSRSKSSNLLTPRALVLAPTHELCRQLSSYAKTLTHEVKLRTICLSNRPPKLRTSQQVRLLALEDGLSGEDVHIHEAREVDVAVGTPSKIAQMARLKIETSEESPSSAAARAKRSDDVDEYQGPRMSFEKVRWIVVDEADVLFG